MSSPTHHAVLATGNARQPNLGVFNRHTCAVLDDTTIKCWGDNPYGELGYGDTNNRGGNAKEMGDNLEVLSLI